MLVETEYSNLYLVLTWLRKFNILLTQQPFYNVYDFVKENPDYESTYVFENDFPALLQEEAPLPGTV